MKLHSKGKLKLLVTLAIMSIAFTAGTNIATAADMSHGANNFYKSDKVNTEIVKFKNIYGMEVTGTLFTPRNMAAGKKYDALIVGHPFAAVRQQAANLYATKMAEAGFVTLSFDQSFWGRVPVRHVERCCLMFMQKTSVLLLIFSEHARL
jgi:hypothetical protein